MSYDETDAARDEFFERMSEELYPEHKDQAITEFTKERLQSYYLKHPQVLKPALNAYHHANSLLDASPSAALIFYTTAIELFLKVVLLKPILYGMIHNEYMADLIMDASTSQAGFSRYTKLLNSLCQQASGIELEAIKSSTGQASIIAEATTIQNIRNSVIHQGTVASPEQAHQAKKVAHLILLEVVEPVINGLELAIGNEFNIVKE
jgi:hypothetical protein